MPNRYDIAVDCGGTNIRIAHGIAGEPMSITDPRVAPTQAHLPREEWRAHFLAVLETYIADQELGGKVRSINIAIAGQIDARRGLVRMSPNLPSLTQAPIGEWVAKHFGCRVYLDNDVRAAALGEFMSIGDPAIRDIVCLYWGTGIGGGIIANGALLRGADNAAAEVGHMKHRVPGRHCNCGKQGCYEAYAGGWGMQAIAREQAAAGDPGWPAAPTAADVFRLAAEGFSPATAIRDEAARLIGLLAADLVVIFNPSKLVLGGGITGHYPAIRPIVTDVVNENVLEIDKAHLAIEVSTLGDHAALLGALHFRAAEEP